MSACPGHGSPPTDENPRDVENRLIFDTSWCCGECGWAVGVSTLVPARTDERVDGAVVELDLEAVSLGQVRAAVRRLLEHATGIGVEDAVQVCDELASNAVVHARARRGSCADDLVPTRLLHGMICTVGTRARPKGGTVMADQDAASEDTGADTNANAAAAAKAQQTADEANERALRMLEKASRK
jgi:hypothetical protein